jgi:hypothetical protein
MARKRKSARGPAPLRFEESADPDFQRRWIEARKLDGEEVNRAFRHGFDARGRFADRPFREVEAYLRESWEGMGARVPWADVRDLVRSGYERYKGAGFDGSIDLGPEALDRFIIRNVTGSTLRGGTMGDRTFLGAAEPTPEFEGEGGPPVGGDGGGRDAGSGVSPPPA